MSGYDWTRRLDAELPDVLEDLAAPRVPEYADVIFERLAKAPQRSRWTFAGRWLPAPVARYRVPNAPVASWRLIVVGLVVLALVAAAIVAVGSRPRVPRPFGLASPGAIGYVADGRIWLAGPDGSGAHPISAVGGTDLHPVFSPDGTKVAFVRLATPGSHTNWEEWGSVIVMDADGGHPVVLDADQEGISPFSWSADGRLLIYSKFVDGVDQLVVAQVDGSGARTITKERWGSLGPVLAPDGRQIAFVRETSSGLQLRATDVVAAIDRSLSSVLVPRFDLAAWSPDGRTIVFGQGEPDSYAADLWQVDVTTGETSPFAAGEGNQLGPTWSPDGLEIAYVDESARNRAVIRVVGSDGASPRGISGVAAWTYPQWSPDGRHIVVADLAPGGVPALVILDAAGLEPARRIDLPDARGAGRADLPAWQRLAP